MMKSTAMFAAATAIALVSGAAALADGNLSHLSQTGDLNAALIDQSAGDGNHAGAASLAIRQNGRQNRLGFEQSGDRNEIGIKGGGFLQQSNRNTVTITQSSNNNKVVEVLQTGMTSTAGGQALRRNTLKIEQKGGDGNVVSRVEQARVRPALDFFDLTDLLAANTTSIVQDGAGNRVGLLSQTGLANEAHLSFTGDYNDARSLQRGAANRADANVTGSRNVIRIDQQSLVLGNRADVAVSGSWNAVDIGQQGFAFGNEAKIAIDGSFNRVSVRQTGDANAVSVDIAGHGNNAWPLFSPGAHRTLAAGAGLAPGDIVQTGASNSIAYSIGSQNPLSATNRFAFRQEGLANRIEGATDGIGNQAVVVQRGMHNFTSFTQVGNANVIGVNQ